jgi:hypothetical protein
MGYFLAAHIVRLPPAADALDRLPAPLNWAAYREPATGAMLIDVFRSDAEPRHPFTRLPRLPDLAEALPGALTPLNELYHVLLRQRRASPFRRRYINLNLLLSRTVDMPVLSFASDDDGLDLACVSVGGQLHRLRFKTDRLEILWTEGRGVIQPLEFDDDVVVSEADLRLLESPSDFKVMAPQQASSALRRIACDECKTFLRTDTSILGLGSSDGYDNIAAAVMRGPQR